MSSNEFGCKLMAESCIILKSGDKCYVDNTIDDIKEQMESNKTIIDVELSMIVNKGRRRTIEKEKIEDFRSNVN